MAKKNNLYRYNEETYPSVTTVLEVIAAPELLDWILHVGKEKSEQIKNAAADFGSAVHGAIEAVAMGQEPYYAGPYKERLELAVRNYFKWSDQNIEKYVTFEKAVYHTELKYAGTLDSIAYLKNGDLVIIDFKTSKKVWGKFYLQLAAYLNANVIEDNIIDMKDLKGAKILKLDHETLTWEALNVVGWETVLFDVFKAALVLWNWKKKN